MLKDPLYRFFFILGVSYLSWYLLYEFLIHPWGFIDQLLINDLIDKTGWLLETLGYTLIPEPANSDNIRTVGVQGGHLLWIGDPCNGLNLFVVYSLFILAYPGPWKDKLWFIPLGLLLIHSINIIRIAVLCIIVTINYELLNFNHDYTFYIVVYGFVFLLWFLWVKKSGKRPTPVTS